MYPGIIVSMMILASCQQESVVITEEHYLRAEAYLRPNISRKVYYLDVQPNWLADSSGFWHVTHTPHGKRFLMTRLDEQTTAEAFDHHQLASLLRRIAQVKADAADLPFNSIRLDSQGNIHFESDGKWFEFDPREALLEVRQEAPPVNSNLISPNGRYEAFVKDYDLYVRERSSGRERRLSNRGKYLLEYGNLYGWDDVMDEANGKRKEQLFVNWSPDSEMIQTFLVDLRNARKMHLLDFTVDTLYRPRVLSYYRGSPGDTTLVYNIPVIFEVASGREVVVDVPPIPHFISVQFQWDEDSRELWALYAHRGFKKVDLIRVDPRTGKKKLVLSEETDLSLEYTNMTFRKAGTDSFLFRSEHCGRYHLYLYDRNTGQLIHKVTDGDFIVQQLLHVDEESGRIYFTASGREEGLNPYYHQLYSIDPDGKNLKLLTPEPAHHQVSLSPCRKYFVDNYSRVDLPTVSLVRDLSTGEEVFGISRADVSELLAMGWRAPESFSVKGRDHQTDIYGVLYLPAGLNPRKSYPLIDYAYSGPHVSIIPKSFREGLVNIMQPFTQFGFAVMVVDGMGTSFRGRDFRAISYRNIGGNMECHVAAIHQLGERYRWIDTGRVGIFGHSAGGYDATRAMLLYPEVFQVGVSSAADHDHRMEKAWWPEMYMGYPVGDYYHEQSNITNASRLQGKLLIAHGGIDENVNPSATFKLAGQLISEGKDFDMLILPGSRHSFGRDGGDYFTKVRWNYFIRHLLGAEPLHNYQFRTIGH